MKRLLVLLFIILLVSPSHAILLLDGNVPPGCTVSAGTLTCVGFAGGGSGLTGVTAASMTVYDTNDTTAYVGLWDNATGSQSPKTDGGLIYNAGTGTLTATAFVGALTGNASTASALAANGSNCSAGQAPLGVDAAGAVESCFAVQASDATLTALAGLSITEGSLIYGTAADTFSVLAKGGANSVLRTNAGATAPEWSVGFTVDATGNVTAASYTTTRVAADSSSDNHYQYVELYEDKDDGDNKTILRPTRGVSPTIHLPATTGTLAILGANTFTGAEDFSSATLRLPTGNADPTAAAGWIRHDSTVSNFTAGALRWHDGSNIRQVVDLVAATAEGCTDDYVVAYDADADLWYCKADAGSGTGDFLADGSVPMTGGLVLADGNGAAPTTDGAMRYDRTTEKLQVGDGAATKEFVPVGVSSMITKYQYFPAAWMEDNATSPCAAAAVISGEETKARLCDDNESVIVGWQVDPEWTAGFKYRVYYGVVTNAEENDTVTWRLAGCSVGNQDALTCTAGDQVSISDELGTDDDANELEITAWSDAVTITDLAAGEWARLTLMRGTDDEATEVNLIGIEIKYQAKVSAASDY